MYIYIIYTPYIAPWNFGENKRIKSNRHQNHQVLSLTSCSIRQLHLAALLEDRHHPTIIQFCKKKMYVTVAVYMVYANYPNPSQSYNVNSYPLVPPLVHLQRCAPPRDVYYDWLDHSTGTPGTLALPPGESRSTRAPRPRWMSRSCEDAEYWSSESITKFCWFYWTTSPDMPKACPCFGWSRLFFSWICHGDRTSPQKETPLTSGTSLIAWLQSYRLHINATLPWNLPLPRNRSLHMTARSLYWACSWGLLAGQKHSCTWIRKVTKRIHMGTGTPFSLDLRIQTCRWCYSVSPSMPSDLISSLLSISIAFHHLPSSSIIFHQFYH